MKHPSGITNKERNLTVAELVYPDANVFASECANYILVTTQLDCGCIYEEGDFNYCNNWGDLMPLVIKHDITYVRTSGRKDPYHVALHPSGIAVEADDLSEERLRIALVDCLIRVLREKGGSCE